MGCNLDIAFLSGLFPKDIEQEIYNNSIGSVQSAANALQWNFVRGFDAVNINPTQIINSLYVGSFPLHYKKLLIRTFSFSHTSESNDINVGFCNLYGFKQLFRFWSLKPYLKAWAKKNENKPKVIIGYALTGTFTKCLKYVKNINPSVKTCILVPDLPEFMNTSNGTPMLYNMFKRLEIKSIKKDMNYIDFYVLLTKYMKDFLCISKPFVVIEGIATDQFPNQKVACDENIKTIMYSGTLHEKYGIMNLLEAFQNIPNSNYRLVICGSGDSQEKVEKAAQKDSRICYKGQLLRKDILSLQQSATVLVNPRQNNEEYTKYSFPSKILEYLSSGTPVIAYKLDGMPDEYDEYLYLVENDSPQDLCETLKKVLSKSQGELNKKGSDARQFVFQEKSSAVQAKKILEMMR